MKVVVYFYFFLIPIFSIATGFKFIGIDIFDILSIGLTLILMQIWFFKFLAGHDVNFSLIDGLIIFYAIWVSILVLTFPEQSKIGEAAKFVIPLLGFIFIKPLIRSRLQFQHCLLLLLLGLLVPTLLSTGMIMQGKGLDVINYWTGLPRYKGIFVNSHNFGHMMSLEIMIGVIYLWFKYFNREGNKRWLTLLEKLVLCTVFITALYCLYFSMVRTALLGFLIFMIVFLYLQNKKLFFLFGTLSGVTVILALPLIFLIFHDVAQVVRGDADADKLGSGRPYIWGHNLTIFEVLPLERKLMGVGVGNRSEIFEAGSDLNAVWNSHNDFLEVMIQTGFIGLLVIIWIHFLIFGAILKLPAQHRNIFLALFFCVLAMNFFSNSYFSRFSLGQIFWIIIAYIQSSAIKKEPRLS